MIITAILRFLIVDQLGAGGEPALFTGHIIVIVRGGANNWRNRGICIQDKIDELLDVLWYEGQASHPNGL